MTVTVGVRRYECVVSCTMYQGSVVVFGRGDSCR